MSDSKPSEEVIWTSASSPAWGDQERQTITLRVVFKAYGELPFTASPTDPMEHGRELYQRARSGEFGVIAPYEEPVLTDDQLRVSALEKRDDLLREASLRIAPLQAAVDLTVATVAEHELLRSWKVYQVTLNRLEAQPDFPRVIDWPTQPTATI